MNRKVLIGLLAATVFTISFAGEASARHRRSRGFGGDGLAAGLLLGSALSGGFGGYDRGYGGYGYGGGGCGSGGYGYAPYGGYGYAPGYAAYDPYAYGGGYGYAPVAYGGYTPYGGGYGYNPYSSRRRRSNILPILIGGAILYSALRR